MHRFTPHVGHLVSLAGSVVMLAGLFLGFGTMARMLFEDVYLAIREGGLLVHENGTDLEVSWDDLAGVDVDLDRGQLAVCKKSGERLVFHGGQSAPDIAARIEEAKRKAAYGLLRAPTA